MGFKFGTSSLIKLNSCHSDLQLIFSRTIEISKVDFGISEGHRPIERQKRLYSIGRTTELHRNPVTNIDGENKKGKHNFNPSHALDIFIYHEHQATRKKIIYDDVHLSYIAGLVDAVAEELFEKGLIDHKIRWGGNWDSDGIIGLDQKLKDLPHFEIIKL